MKDKAFTDKDLAKLQRIQENIAESSQAAVQFLLTHQQSTPIKSQNYLLLVTGANIRNRLTKSMKKRV